MSSNTIKNIAKISAAGSGKTWDICHEALQSIKNSDKKVLIISYTNRGVESIKGEIRKQNDGVLHPQIVIKTWYRFLLSDAIKPYQTWITRGEINHIKSIDFSEVYGVINRYKSGTYYRYITSGKNVRSNYVSELAVILNERNCGKTISRLEEVYSYIYFDEIQDLAGYDIQILQLLIKSSIGITCCGDNKQATFQTHNTRKNKNQTGTNIWEFFKNLEETDAITVEKNLASRRFNKEICFFANMVYPTEDPITTIMDISTGHDGVFLIGENDVENYYDHFKPQVLRYDARTKVQYPCVNFGACKGETFDRVLIFPNGPLMDFILKGSPIKSPEKYYVAVTRCRFSTTFVIKQLPTTLNNYQEIIINIGSSKIRMLKHIISVF